jgi:hypothetical protein
MSQCNHTFVNCGFTSLTMACKKCGLLESDYKKKLAKLFGITENIQGIYSATAIQTSRHQSATPNQSNLEKIEESANFLGLYKVPYAVITIQSGVTTEVQKDSWFSPCPPATPEEIAAFNKLLSECYLDPNKTIVWPSICESLRSLVQKTNLLSGTKEVPNEAPDVGPAEFFTRDYLESFYEPKERS